MSSTLGIRGETGKTGCWMREMERESLGADSRYSSNFSQDLNGDVLVLSVELFLCDIDASASMNPRQCVE